MQTNSQFFSTRRSKLNDMEKFVIVFWGKYVTTADLTVSSVYCKCNKQSWDHFIKSCAVIVLVQMRRYVIPIQTRIAQFSRKECARSQILMGYFLVDIRKRTIASSPIYRKNIKRLRANNTYNNNSPSPYPAPEGFVV